MPPNPFLGSKKRYHLKLACLTLRSVFGFHGSSIETIGLENHDENLNIIFFSHFFSYRVTLVIFMKQGENITSQASHASKLHMSKIYKQKVRRKKEAKEVCFSSPPSGLYL